MSSNNCKEHLSFPTFNKEDSFFKTPYAERNLSPTLKSAFSIYSTDALNFDNKSPHKTLPQGKKDLTLVFKWTRVFTSATMTNNNRSSHLYKITREAKEREKEFLPYIRQRSHRIKILFN